MSEDTNSAVNPTNTNTQVSLHVPPDAHLSDRVHGALDDFVRAIQDEPPKTGPDLTAEAECQKVWSGPCAVLFTCDIVG